MARKSSFFFSCSVFSIHEICILWLFLSDMIDCVSRLKGFGVWQARRVNPSVILGLLDSLKPACCCWLRSAGPVGSRSSLASSNLILHLCTIMRVKTRADYDVRRIIWRYEASCQACESPKRAELSLKIVFPNLLSSINLWRRKPTENLLHQTMSTRHNKTLQICF